MKLFTFLLPTTCAFIMKSRFLPTRLYSSIHVASVALPKVSDNNASASQPSYYEIYDWVHKNSTMTYEEWLKDVSGYLNGVVPCSNNETNKPGYPRQANLNISYPDMSDLDDLDSEEMDIFKKLLNENVQEDIEKTQKKMEEEMQRRRDLEQAFLPMGIRVVKVTRENEEGTEGPKDSSENFQVERNISYSFKDVGGYKKVKDELLQSVDILTNYEKYQKFSVRTPKGMILEGPPGNGKTLIAKGYSGEVNASFIAVSGSQFLEKYVGVGASRVRELFELARENKPCIIFIDEIDAIGKSRGTGEAGENQNSEAQATLNELLVNLDGYQSNEGVFVIGATNRVDLLDNALIRPGRIDKKIYVGNPDAETRREILKIHIKGKPKNYDVNVEDLVDMTNGLSGAEIENLLNEAMLFALRENREFMINSDLENIMSRMLVGYQSTENTYSDDMIRRIAIHEMGHAIVGIFSLDHAKLVKVCLNVWSPSSPGYTIFENAEIDSNIYTKEKLENRLMVLLGGRIAEEVFFGASITSGASKDIEEAYSLAEKMITKFGMGRKLVVPYYSENSKVSIDRDIERLVENAYNKAHAIITKTKPIMDQCSNELISNKLLLPERIYEINKKHGMEI